MYSAPKFHSRTAVAFETATQRLAKRNENSMPTIEHKFKMVEYGVTGDSVAWGICDTNNNNSIFFAVKTEAEAIKWCMNSKFSKPVQCFVKSVENSLNWEKRYNLSRELTIAENTPVYYN